MLTVEFISFPSITSGFIVTIILIMIIDYTLIDRIRNKKKIKVSMDTNSALSVVHFMIMMIIIMICKRYFNVIYRKFQNTSDKK